MGPVGDPVTAVAGHPHTLPTSGRQPQAPARPTPALNPGRAVEMASDVDISSVRFRERRAHFLIDLAQGYEQWDKEDQSVEALLEAEHNAPEEVRYLPAARALVASLLQRKPDARLQALAARVGAGT